MLAILCVAQMAAGCDVSIGFADALMRQADYYRAITEYKRVIYECPGDSLQKHSLLQIATAYRKSGKLRSSVRYSEAFLQRSDLSASQRWSGNVNLGMAYLEDHMPQFALPPLRIADASDTTGFPALCLGLADLQMRRLESAEACFSKGEATSRDSMFRQQAAALARATEQFSRRPRKSSLAASLMSAVVPGAGQVYCGHTYDGIQAFLYTASAAFATYAMYRYEHDVKDHLALTYVGLSITTMFHSANILGAHRTARYYNWKQEQDFSDSAQKEVYQLAP